MSVSLAAGQEALVAALTGGAPVPAGFDARLVGVARQALLRKRGGVVARHWPMLAAGHGAEWITVFAEWADGRPTNGSLRDGWDFARARGVRGAGAEEELARREAAWVYDGVHEPRPRRMPALRRTPGMVFVQFGGRIFSRRR
ncbi:hypothetical protein J2S43_000674 [Catenuloplanes nepalensis]|uniref:SCO6045-like C-terminal domain-containing protein n=1 Tax=Catenuloplanes nepalensis TaxID=587533 RepID=A0ABT9ML64_9ACTN|nr:hypothetical protein [Catenuloplanes nepalensis]MDP9792162.1 hypothetical protein [Catenuloplanes nepalensis]